jgi:phospholipase C
MKPILTFALLLVGSSVPRSVPVTAQYADIQTVFVIVLENHDWSEIQGNPSAPYINTALLPRGAHAERFYNPPGVHPSLPNYLWLEAGQDFGIRDDNDPATHHQATRNHLVTLLETAGVSWKAYEEDADGSTCPLVSSGLYAVKHNPFVYFDDVTNRNDPGASECLAHVRPYTELADDLQRNATARYNFITPNICHDMHDCSVQAGDSWLSTEVPRILASAAYQHAVLFITFDESEHSDGPIGMIALSPYAKAGYASWISYTHSSTLRTIQEILGVTPLLGDAQNAVGLGDLFLQPGQLKAPTNLRIIRAANATVGGR